jgi:hypothetical protein
MPMTRLWARLWAWAAAKVIPEATVGFGSPTAVPEPDVDDEWLAAGDIPPADILADLYTERHPT